jgi:hypothetical protein
VFHTVYVGMTADDKSAAFAKLQARALREAISGAVGLLTGSGGPYNPVDAVLSQLGLDPKGLAVKNELAIVFGQTVADATGKKTTELGFSNPYAGKKVTLAKNSDGTVTKTTETSVYGMKHTRSVTGDKVTETTKTSGLFSTTTDTVKTDAQGNRTVTRETTEHSLFGDESTTTTTTTTYDSNGNVVDGSPAPAGGDAETDRGDTQAALIGNAEEV